MSGRVLLVDDETYITKNLQQVIPWQELGLTVIGTARNGREALERLKREPIDLLLCDIRMPIMDGLELVRDVRDLSYDCDIIMLSGYQDFEYTRAAIRYGVKDYILKPIQYEELTEIIRKTISDRRKRVQALREQNVRYDKMIDLVNEKILYDILMDYADVTPNSLVLAGKEHSLHEKRYVLMVLDVDRYSHISRHWTDKDRKLWNYAVHKVVGEVLQELGLPYAVVQMRDGEWCAIVQSSSDPHRASVAETATRWAEQIHAAVRIIKKELNIGICADIISLTELSSAYKTVQMGMQLNTARAHVSQYVLSSRKAHEDTDMFVWQTASELVTALRGGELERAEQVIFRLSERLQTVRDTSVQRIQQMLNFIVLHLLREMKQYGLATASHEERIWGKIELGLSIKDLSETVRDWLKDSALPIEAEKKKSHERMMEEAKSFIDRHLSSDLAVDEVAGYLGISSSYFSLLFKQAFGETFLEYVTRQRMEKAKSLLMFTTKSVASIAAELGYSDRRYFNKVFVKFTGEKPLDFRQLRRAPQ